MPTRKLWDHAIETKEGFVLKKEKVYPLLREEIEKVCEFVNEQLRKGYIRPLKLPQMTPVFFAGKKDGKKHMVQDYQYLNKWTIKNNYPLPLISDIVENIGTKRVFTKLDLWWGYNNVWIKKGDKWKAAFTTLEGSFEPMVMFFGLTNSPMPFQTIMNKIPWDLINTGEVASFINDIIIETEEEEGHDEVVEKVVRRLMENDLYVKLEKCKWKVKKVRFLEVVIEPEGIKMEEEKVKDILDWPTPKGIKDIQKFLGLANYYCWFIKDFTVIARPLHNMVKKDQKWEWMERQEEALKNWRRCLQKNWC